MACLGKRGSQLITKLNPNSYNLPWLAFPFVGLTGPRAASSAEPPKWPAHAHPHAFGRPFCASFLQSKPPAVLIRHCLAPSQCQDQLHVTLTLHQHILMYVLSPLRDCNPWEVAIGGRLLGDFFFLVAKGQSRLQGILVCVPVQMYMNLACKGEGFWMTGLASWQVLI